MPCACSAAPCPKAAEGAPSFPPRRPQFDTLPLVPERMPDFGREEDRLKRPVMGRRRRAPPVPPGKCNYAQPHVCTKPLVQDRAFKRETHTIRRIHLSEKQRLGPPVAAELCTRFVGESFRLHRLASDQGCACKTDSHPPVADRTQLRDRPPGDALTRTAITNATRRWTASGCRLARSDGRPVPDDADLRPTYCQCHRRSRYADSGVA